MFLRRALSRLNRPRELTTGLQACPLCASEYVHPADWEPISESHWWIRLRCGECETFREITAENEVAARFELELHRGTDALARIFERIDRRRMIADVERMVAALREDRVRPADFAW